MATFEVEVRGPLTREQYENLKIFLQKEGLFVEEKHRLFVDFTACVSSEELANRELDVRARITNGEPEMIIKVGRWQGSGSRKEISVKLKEGEFSHLISAYAALGYKKGILGERKIHTYTYQDVEFAVVEVPEHSYYFEAEILVNEGQNTEDVLAHLRTQCAVMGLELFSDQGFHDYIEKLNKESNKVFDFEKDGEEYFEQKF